MAADGTNGTGRRETLDSQLVHYWEREAARLDGFAARARFGWMARGYARKAERARGLAERSRAREASRGALPSAAGSQEG